MDIKQVRELIELMKENDLNEMKIVDGETRIFLRRGPANPEVIMPGMIPPPMMPMPAVPASVAAAPVPVETKPECLQEIVSPIVGTFYAAPSPSAQPYLKLGDVVNPDDVVCIIEAMKVMNEVKSEIHGTVKKILVENGAAVEFGQPLFLVEPD